MTMHPQAKNKANISSMAVTITLVFSDESHREMWLRRMEVISEPRVGHFNDYGNRKGSQNLLYIVDPIGPGDFDQEKNATGTFCTCPTARGSCGAPQFDLGHSRHVDHIECQNGHLEDEDLCSVPVRGEPCGERRYRRQVDASIYLLVCANDHREQVLPEPES